MTTIFAGEGLFLCLDSRWSFGSQIADEWPTSKFVVVEGELHIFAGHEVPILLEQAVQFEILPHDDYVLLTRHLIDTCELNGYEDPVMETAILSADNGSAIDLTEADFYFIRHGNGNLPAGVRHDTFFWLGSGGKHASEFFYHAHKRKRKSIKGCNLLGALNHASRKDIGTGGRFHSWIWADSGYFVRNSNRMLVEFDSNSYCSYLRTQIDNLLSEMEQLEMNAKVPEYRSAFLSKASSGSVEGLRKVTMSNALARLQKTIERKNSKKAGQ